MELNKMIYKITNRSRNHNPKLMAANLQLLSQLLAVVPTRRSVKVLMRDSGDIWCGVVLKYRIIQRTLLLIVNAPLLFGLLGAFSYNCCSCDSQTTV